jgi:hypothetical protein
MQPRRGLPYHDQVDVPITSRFHDFVGRAASEQDVPGNIREHNRNKNLLNARTRPPASVSEI